MSVQIRRDPAARWTSVDPVLGDMELGCESDTGKVKLGDGSTAWSSLNYAATTEPVYSFQGSTSGYTSGGTPPTSNVIDKFPFSSDGNATDVGDLSVARYAAAGQSSADNGYSSGGYAPTNPPTPAQNIIDKFPFSSDANATDAGDLTVGRARLSGQSSENNGYSSGGQSPHSSPTVTNIIDKFPFASDGNATDVGDITAARYDGTAQSSSDNGYTSGGIPGPNLTVIDKFPFASDANATDVGDLTIGRFYLSGQSSSESGYASGGYGSGVQNTIDKFPFSSDANATDVGDLTGGRYATVGQSSTASGYTSGGLTPTVSNVIDKFPFASDGNATDVGDLTVARHFSAGQQV